MLWFAAGKGVLLCLLITVANLLWFGRRFTTSLLMLLSSQFPMKQKDFEALSLIPQLHHSVLFRFFKQAAYLGFSLIMQHIVCNHQFFNNFCWLRSQTLLEKLTV
jgi:hypothetical protein